MVTEANEDSLWPSLLQPVATIQGCEPCVDCSLVWRETIITDFYVNALISLNVSN